MTEAELVLEQPAERISVWNRKNLSRSGRNTPAVIRDMSACRICMKQSGTAQGKHIALRLWNFRKPET